MGNALVEMGLFDRAIVSLQTAIGMFTTLLGSEHPDTLHAKEDLRRARFRGAGERLGLL